MGRVAWKEILMLLQSFVSHCFVVRQCEKVRLNGLDGVIGVKRVFSFPLMYYYRSMVLGGSGIWNHKTGQRLRLGMDMEL